MPETGADAVNLLIWVQAGQILTTVLGFGGVFWGARQWWIRDENFPRMGFEVDVNFVGEKEDQIVCELVAVLDNKGTVPLQLNSLTFKLLGILESDNLTEGGEKIRNQLLFPNELCQGAFIPKDWDYSFVSPGVKTEYNFVVAIPRSIVFIRMQGDFEYSERGGESHHAAKVLAVPKAVRDAVAKTS